MGDYLSTSRYLRYCCHSLSDLRGDNLATYQQMRLRNLKDFEETLNEQMIDLAREVSDVVLFNARGGLLSQRTVPNTRDARNKVKRDVWSSVLKPYFIGTGDDAFDGPNPKSPYTRLMVEHIDTAIRIEAKRQVSIIQKYTRKDPQLFAFLTGPRPVRLQEMTYDPFHMFVYGNSPYTLSHRVWNTSTTVRAAIDAFLDYEISQGTAAVDIADLLVAFLKSGPSKWLTKKPYGTYGSYAARRLARTEITAAAGRALINAAKANPYVEHVRWNLSASHPKRDICDDIVANGIDGKGLYLIDNTPLYPAHPHCLCYLTPEVVGEPALVTVQMSNDPELRKLQGAFNEAWLTEAMKTGLWNEQILKQLEEDLKPRLTNVDNRQRFGSLQ